MTQNYLSLLYYFKKLRTRQIQKPFNLIDTMGEENKEWNFKEDDNINVFTYLSMFGSGKMDIDSLLTQRTTTYLKKAYIHSSLKKE